MSDELLLKPRKGRPPKSAPVDREPVHEPVHEAAHGPDMSQWDDFVLPDQEGQVSRTHIPKDMIPDGMDYRWVTLSVLGQPFPHLVAEAERNGWRPVPAMRYDGMFMPKGYQGHIQVDATGLYERPLVYSTRARQADTRKANDQVRAKEQQIRGGNIEGVSLDTTHPTAVRTNKVRKNYERLDVPD